MKDEGLKLDLYNYDLPEYGDCPYILTSPRSLEACRRLNIKPVELLQVSREDFDANHQDLSLEDRVVTYHRKERQRLKCLGEARSLRDRLVLNEERRARRYEQTPTSGDAVHGIDADVGGPSTSSVGYAEGKEKGEKETPEKKDSGKKKKRQEETKRSSPPPPEAASLEKEESGNSSSSSLTSSKEQKEQENIARSLSSKEADNSTERASKRRDSQEDTPPVEEFQPLKAKTEVGEEKIKRKEEQSESEEHEYQCPEFPSVGDSAKEIVKRDKNALTSGKKPTEGSSLPVSRTVRKPKTGRPRPSSAQRVKKGGGKPPFDAKPLQLGPQERASSSASSAYTRIPGEPYRSSLTPKGRGAKPSGRSTRPSSATPKTTGFQNLGSPEKRKGLPVKQQTTVLTFKEGQPRSALRPSSGARPKSPTKSSGTWPRSAQRHVTSADPTVPNRPRITWASTPPLYQGARRSSDSSVSLASSFSDITAGDNNNIALHGVTIEPPGTESDDGTPSANSAAECDRQTSEGGDEEGDIRKELSSLSQEGHHKHVLPYRLAPTLPTTFSAGRWSPCSDSTTLTPASTPRLPRRRTPTPTKSCPRAPSARRRFTGRRRVSSARPASSTPPPARQNLSGSLDEIGTKADRGSGLCMRTGHSSLDFMRPQSANSSLASSSATYRISRFTSGLTRSQSMRSSVAGVGSSAGGNNSPRDPNGVWSPRLLPQHRSVSTVSLADSQILSKFMDGLDNTEVPVRDLRILEMLAMKHEKHFVEEQKSHMAHRAWFLQKEKDQKEAAAQWAEWRSHVNEKRRLENEENERRWKKNEEFYLQSQENLAHHIYSKERRSRELLDMQFESRRRRLEERRAAESARKAAQEASLRAKEEAEERKRQHLIKLWEQQQQLVDLRKKEREEFFRKRVEDGNSAEAERHEARRELVESRGNALLEAMRANMEDRLSRAEANLQLLNAVKEDTLRRQRDERDRRSLAVRALHHQLEASMMQWRQHVLTRQMESMSAAEARQEQFLHTRANRIHADRAARMSHQQELLQMVLAREEAELQMAKKCLEAKDLRSLEVSRERERQIARARTTANTTASLRENLRKKLAPETFDKVVARANLELRIENRPPATSTLGTRSHIFLG
ncbi:calponin homology domain-containing protein DDB_G0272472-like [Palaemon carinicauda]|uniref:calponin homology domain-containing protein DDB_G0272472-like n=1 Tax=Palaemon carinicauda TaxID=392227 RepID=UPI0035B58F22